MRYNAVINVVIEMKRFDLRHTVFHILVAIYFIWAFVFAILLAMAISSAMGAYDAVVTRMFLVWIFMNLLMGLVLFIVLRLFGNNSRLVRNVVLVSFGALLLAALGVVFVVTGKS